MRFLVFAASHRPESHNRKLAMYAANYLRGIPDVEIDYADYGEFDMPGYNGTIDFPESAHSFAARAQHVNGIIISSPEYNWSYPGSLKNIIDWTSCFNPNPIAGRTVMLMSATPGMRGGILGMDHLKTPLESIQLHVFHRMFALGNSHQAFTASNDLMPRFAEQLNPMLQDYVTFTRKLTN